jgi:hypothetical protein
LRYLSKFAVLRHANLEIRARNAYFLQLSKIVRFTQQFPSGTSPLPAERIIGLEPMLRAIKNPASSAGHVRPFAWAAFSRAASRTDMLEARFADTRCL